MLIHPDRLFPAEPGTRKIARTLYEHVRTLPIVSPHGHTQAAWFARNEPFPDPAKLFVQPDHYIFRMLYSQGVSLEDLEIGQPEVKDARRVWRIFASHYYLFRGTPTRLWLDFAFQELFGLEQRLSEETADLYFDTISEKLRTPEFLPRALYERFQFGSAGDDRFSARFAGRSQGHPRIELEGEDSADLPARPGCRS
jgi:glucuronate isomerase